MLLGEIFILSITLGLFITLVVMIISFLSGKSVAVTTKSIKSGKSIKIGARQDPSNIKAMINMTYTVILLFVLIPLLFFWGELEKINDLNFLTVIFVILLILLMLLSKRIKTKRRR